MKVYCKSAASFQASGRLKRALEGWLRNEWFISKTKKVCNLYSLSIKLYSKKFVFCIQLVSEQCVFVKCSQLRSKKVGWLCILFTHETCACLQTWKHKSTSLVWPFGEQNQSKNGFSESVLPLIWVSVGSLGRHSGFGSAPHSHAWAAGTEGRKMGEF